MLDRRKHVSDAPVSPSAGNVVRNPDVVVREENGGALLFNPDSNQIRFVNASALVVWNACDGRRDVSSMVALLQRTFEGITVAQCEQQVSGFIDEMTASGFLGMVQSRGD